MRLTDTPTGYGWISIALHWIVAALVIAVFLIGEQFEDMSREAAAPWIAWHYQLGLLAGLFIALRIAGRLGQGHPPYPDDHRLVALLSKIVQWSLLLLPLVLVITGPLSVWMTGRPIDMFGLFQIASPFERNRELHELFEEIHELASKPLIPLFALHVLGALKHAVVNRDGVFLRMVRPAKG